MFESSMFNGRLISIRSSVNCTLASCPGSELLLIKTLRCFIFTSSIDEADVMALALSSGMSWTGIFTVLPHRPVSELDLLIGRCCWWWWWWISKDPFVLSGPFFLLNEFDASLLQAEKTSLAASPLKPRAASHSAKIDCHLFDASTVQFPILLSSFAILGS